MLIGIEFATGLLGLFLAFPLLAMRRSRPANAWLGLFVLSVSLLTLAFPVYASHLEWFGLFDWPLAAVGAFFYCYVRSLTGLGNTRRQAWHFVPLLLFAGALAVGRVRMSGRDLLAWLQHDSFFTLLLLGFQVLAAGYAVASLVRLAQYRRRLRERYSSTGRRELTWLSWLSIVFIALLVLWIPTNLFGGIWSLLLIGGRLLTLYFVGWFGLRQTVVFMPPLAADGAPQPAAATAAVATAAAAASAVAVADDANGSAPPAAGPLAPSAAPVPDDTALPESDKYVRSGMTDAASELIGVRLARRAAHERDHLDPDVKLTDLAERIGTSPQLLSQYLNHVLGVNFFDYINGLRVAEVQNLMRDPANDGRTLLDLAYAAGFNSKSTFNTSFKKISGLAPSAWRSRHARTSVPIGQDVS
jgi:AraC-like DNA-binding protein